MSQVWKCVIGLEGGNFAWKVKFINFVPFMIYYEDDTDICTHSKLLVT